MLKPLSGQQKPFRSKRVEVFVKNRLAGREQELAQLLQWAHKERVGLVDVQGDAGVGKSTLLRAFSEIPAAKSLIIFETCQIMESAPEPIGLLGHLLDQLAQHLTGTRLRHVFTDRCLQDLATLSPGMVQKATHLTDLEFDTQREVPRFQIVEALVELIKRIASRERLVFVIDEFQNIDEQSRLLLTSLLTHPDPGARSFSLVVSYRGLSSLSFRKEWEETTGSFPGYQQFQLRPLSREGLNDLLAQELDASFPQLHPEFVDEVYGLSGGNPFMSLGLLRKARRTGQIRASLQGWKLVQGPSIQKEDLPGLLADQLEPFISQRPLSRFLLSWYRLVGHPVSIEPLIRVAPDMKSEWSSLTAEMTVAGILKKHEYPGGARWSFSHPLWYEFKCDWLMPEELRDFVRQVAEILDPTKASDLFLRASLLSHPLVLQGKDADLRSVQDDLSNLLQSYGDQQEFLNPLVTLIKRLASIAVDDEAYSRAIGFLISANRRLGQLDQYTFWVEKTDLRRLSGSARSVLIDNYLKILRINGRLHEFIPWSDALIRDHELTHEERVLIATERCTAFIDRADEKNALLELENINPDSIDGELRFKYDTLFHVCTTGLIESPFEALDATELYYTTQRHNLTDGTRSGLVLRRLLLGRMQMYSHQSGQRLRMHPYYEDTMESANAQSGFASVAMHRSRLARSLILFRRFDKAAEILRENRLYFVSRGQERIAMEEAFALLTVYRNMRENHLAVTLAKELLPTLMAIEKPDELITILLATSASIFWRSFHTQDSLSALERVMTFTGLSRHRDLVISAGYSQVHASIQVAETSGDWTVVVEPANRQIEIYQSLNRRDAEFMLFAAIRDRAHAELGTLQDSSSKAKDFLAFAESCSKAEFALVSLLIQIGETALLLEEDEVFEQVDLLVEEFAKGPEAGVIAAFRASIATGKGRSSEANNQLWRTTGFAFLFDLPALTIHAAKRFSWEANSLNGVDAQTATLLAKCLHKALASNGMFQLASKSLTGDALLHFAKSMLDQLRTMSDSFGFDERETLLKELYSLEEELGNFAPEGEKQQSLSLHLFRGPRFEVNGTPHRIRGWGTRYGPGILSLLAVNQWRKSVILSRREIIDAVWEPGEMPSSASAFRVLLTRLRGSLAKVTPRESILGSNEGYSLAPDFYDHLDLAEFELALKSARAAKASAKKSEMLRAYGRMIELYEGPFLGEMEADWILPLRSYCEERFLEAARAVLAHLSRTKAKSAVSMRWQLVEKHPELAEELGLSDDMIKEQRGAYNSRNPKI
jgi:DNA-binding SARP family transcriptional activator